MRSALRALLAVVGAELRVDAAYDRVPVERAICARLTFDHVAHVSL
jgi:hypothetical protein